MEEVPMTERGVIFGADDVRRIQDGTKSMFRRAITPQPVPRYRSRQACAIAESITQGVIDGQKAYDNLPDMVLTDPRHGGLIKQSFAPGDRIYVRETWYETADDWVVYRADGEMREVRHGQFTGKHDAAIITSPCQWPWRSPATMPKWAARIWLVVTAVRAEPLQNISIDDLIAEGFPATHSVDADASQAYEWFADTWDANAKSGSTWDDNPWVWVTTAEKEA
jgi:hypothetical protein